MEKKLYRNTGEGQIGVVKVSRRGEERSIAVMVGDEIWLTEEERELTAHAPRNKEDNPFLPRQVPVDVRNEETGAFERKMIDQPPRLTEIPDAERRPTEPAAGSYAQGEEVGTPEAQSV